MSGALSKMTWKHIAIIGVVICAIIGASLYFLLIKKQQEEIARLTTELESVRQVAGTRDSAAKELAQAIADKRKIEQRLAIYERTKMIPLSLNSEVEKYHSMVRLWREQAEVLGPLMERHIGSTGVVMANAASGAIPGSVAGDRFSGNTGAAIIQVPAPPAQPAGITPGWYRIPLGTVTVQTRRGLPHVRDFLRSFTRAPRLVTVGAPSIQGRSPQLTVTVPLEVFYLVKGSPAPAAGAGEGEGMSPEGAGGPPPEGSGAPANAEE